jgi:uncharacterized protein involved in oxidation of intracellular sulfur
MSDADDGNKLVVICTHGPDSVDHSTLAFTMANAALAMDVNVIMILQADGVLLARQGIARHVRAPFLTPLDELIKTYLEQGGKIYACTPCCKSRNLEKSELIEGTELITAGFVIDETMKAKQVMMY